jgi:hypothetical protein
VSVYNSLSPCFWTLGMDVYVVGLIKLPETVNSSSLDTLYCIDCPLYIVVSCLGCVVVSCLVCTVVVVLSALLLVV